MPRHRPLRPRSPVAQSIDAPWAQRSGKENMHVNLRLSRYRRAERERIAAGRCKRAGISVAVRAITACAFATSLTVAAATDGAPVDGRGGRFDDELFAQLEGEWLLTRQIRGTEVKNTVVADWVLQHQFLHLRMRDVATPPRYEAEVYIGYAHAAKEYVAHWIDNFGGHYSAVGRGRREGHSVAFRFEYPDGPFFNTFTWDPATGTWTCHLEAVGKDGVRSTFARDRLVRQP